jgi:hypothetical protein
VFWSRKSTAAPAARALVTPGADFFLIGGASLLTLIAFWLFTLGWAEADATDLQNRAAWWAYGLAFAVNYPHFAYSYLLFYPDYFRRLTGTETSLQSKIRLFVAGLLVPLLMVAYFVYAFHDQNPRYLSWATLAMIFSVGWHYVRQGYGVLITLSVYRGVFYNTLEKNILNINAYVVWIYTWCRTNSGVGVQPYYTITYETFGYPGWVVQGFLILSWATGLAAAAVLLKHWLLDKKGISVNGVAGYVAAIYLWVMLPYMHMAFYVFIPLFHSLQYLPFVFKFKRSEFMRAQHAPEGDARKTRRRALFWAASFALAGFALGAGFFEFIPKYIDDTFFITPDKLELDANFFLISFLVFINIHHFFIDSAFWRRDNQKVQQYLFKA